MCVRAGAKRARGSKISLVPLAALHGRVFLLASVFLSSRISWFLEVPEERASSVPGVHMASLSLSLCSPLCGQWSV
uniref:Putative secreted protein n=1 Tax=Anopheles darlingi TaxID=43151 RepID=A0A2M4DG05_ANODA